MDMDWTKEEIEAFLTEKAGEPVIVDCAHPCIVKVVSLLKWKNVAAAAFVYKDDAGVTRASFIPFGAHLTIEDEMDTVHG